MVNSTINCKKRGGDFGVSEKCIVQKRQKRLKNFFEFMHTYADEDAIIITVKTPQYIIEFLLHPIVKIPSPKRGSRSTGCLFYCLKIEKKVKKQKSIKIFR